MIGFSPLLLAGNTPCSRGAGGISHCQNGKFVCNDGRISQSVKKCFGYEKPDAPADNAKPATPPEPKPKGQRKGTPS